MINLNTNTIPPKFTNYSNNLVYKNQLTVKSEINFASNLNKSLSSKPESITKSTDLLKLDIEQGNNSLDKPMPLEFSKKAGISYDEAHRVLYSVVGGNLDNRDWSKVMSSNNIYQTAIEATSQFLNNLPPTSDLYLSKEGNIAITKKSDTKVSLGLVTDQGHLLTSLGTKANIDDFELLEIQEFIKKFGLHATKPL